MMHQERRCYRLLGQSLALYCQTADLKWRHEVHYDSLWIDYCFNVWLCLVSHHIAPRHHQAPAKVLYCWVISSCSHLPAPGQSTVPQAHARLQNKTEESNLLMLHNSKHHKRKAQNSPHLVLQPRGCQHIIRVTVYINKTNRMALF